MERELFDKEGRLVLLDTDTVKGLDLHWEKGNTGKIYIGVQMSGECPPGGVLPPKNPRTQCELAILTPES